MTNVMVDVTLSFIQAKCLQLLTAMAAEHRVLMPMGESSSRSMGLELLSTTGSSERPTQNISTQKHVQALN